MLWSMDIRRKGVRVNLDTPQTAFDPYQITVSFEIYHPLTREILSIKEPLARMSAIKSRDGDAPLYRPVINIPLTIADIRLKQM